MPNESSDSNAATGGSAADSFNFTGSDSAVRRGPIRGLILCGIVLIASIAIGAAIAIESLRSRALEAHKHELENTSLLLARHFDQRLEDFVRTERDAAAQIQELAIFSPEVFNGAMSTLEIHEMLRKKVSGSTDVSSVNLYSSEGILINSSETWPVPHIDISDRHYFQTLKSNASSTSQIQLVQSRFIGRWTILFAQKLVGPHGEFRGLLAQGLDPVAFEDFFRSMALPAGASVGLFHADGTLLARYPHVESMMGKNFKASPVHQEILSRSSHGTMQLESPVDGLSRLASAYRLSKFPVAIIVSTTVAEALADWREQTKLLIAAAGLTALVIGVILSLIVRQLTRQYQSSRRQLDTALNNMTQGLMLYDASSRIVLFNRRYIEMYGLSLDVIQRGRLFRDVMKHRKATGSFNGDPETFCTNVLRNVAERRLTHTILETKAGRSFQIVNQPLADGGWVATHEDITALTRSEERIKHLAHYDALTDLPNRLLFRAQLERHMKTTANGEKFALLYIDVDEFKGINDSLGHPVGDEFLKSLAMRLRACVREIDFVARLGGDEFAVILTAVESLTDVTELVARIHGSIRQPFQCLGHQILTDASIGAAVAPADGSDIDELIKNADLAMYDAKAAGRRTFRFFESKMDAKVKTRRTLELDLHEAISTGAFELHYQPLVDLQSNEVTGCEALVRWRHPGRGLISPAEFIPVAEETGLINQIGEWVLTTACTEATTWPPHIKLAVNVSPVQFRSGSLALNVVKALASSGLRANRLELEITEAVLIRDDEAALDVLHQLRAVGVSIALDDFGTGYSSLSYLQRFPFDKIKIDRSFIRDVARPGGSSSIIQAVVNIAVSRNMTTTAEGVETEEQRDALRALDCTQMQGYLFSAAVPSSEIRTLLYPVGAADAEAPLRNVR